jgi:hypothetical protein
MVMVVVVVVVTEMKQGCGVVTEGKIIHKFRPLRFPVNAPVHLVKGCKKNNIQIVTVEFAVDLSSGLRWGKPKGLPLTVTTNRCIPVKNTLG